MSARGAAVAGTPRASRFEREPDKEMQAAVYVVRRWLDKERIKPPGLTHAEVAIVELLIADLEAG